MISAPALREISQLQHQANQLLAQRNISRSDAKKADILIAKIANIRQAGFSSDEQRAIITKEIGREIGAGEHRTEHEHLFRGFLMGAPDSELEQRAASFLAGQQTPAFTAGPEGGVLVPIAFAQRVAEGRALVDPLFNPNLVTLIQEDGFTCPPLSIPGWDLSAITAVKVAETVQHNPDVIPALNTEMTNCFMYRLTLAASIEAEADMQAYGSTEAAMARALGIGMGRGVGADLISGDGSTGPQGALTGAANSGYTTASPSELTLDDLTAIFFSVNPIYRESIKCAWLMADATYKLVRNAVDGAQRPLISLDAVGQPSILGRPVYISPTMPSGASSKAILFGDFSAYYVHSSSLLLRRRTQYPGLVEYGKVAFTALQWVDAKVDDPTDGALPPLVYATMFS